MLMSLPWSDLLRSCPVDPPASDEPWNLLQNFIEPPLGVHPPRNLQPWEGEFPSTPHFKQKPSKPGMHTLLYISALGGILEHGCTFAN